MSKILSVCLLLLAIALVAIWYFAKQSTKSETNTLTLRKDLIKAKGTLVHKLYIPESSATSSGTIHGVQIGSAFASVSATTSSTSKSSDKFFFFVRCKHDHVSKIPTCMHSFWEHEIGDQVEEVEDTTCFGDHSKFIKLNSFPAKETVQETETKVTAPKRVKRRKVRSTKAQEQEQQLDSGEATTTLSETETIEFIPEDKQVQSTTTVSSPNDEIHSCEASSSQ